MSSVSGHLLYYVCSLWSSPVLCPQSLVISCNIFALVTLLTLVGIHQFCANLSFACYTLCHFNFSAAYIYFSSCTMSAVFGHLLYYVRG
ncbi:unnamed protein product, partial [Staurois parvus]